MNKHHAVGHLYAITAVIQHMLPSKSDSPNTFGARLPVSTQLNIPASQFHLPGYHDVEVVDFPRFGWSVNYTAEIPPHPLLL